MEPSTGRRETNKQATRTAVREAAKRLFSERGYDATTVRDIAHAAGVTERTFYRYFDGKEGLIAEETLAWIQILHDTIHDRPADEPPLEAIKNAMIDVAQQARTGTGPASVWLFSDQPRPLALIRRSSPRLLLRFEDSIADALLSRTLGDKADAPPDKAAAEFVTQLLARVAVAALRSAAIYHRQLARNHTHSPSIEQLLQDAFAALNQPQTPP